MNEEYSDDDDNEYVISEYSEEEEKKVSRSVVIDEDSVFNTHTEQTSPQQEAQKIQKMRSLSIDSRESDIFQKPNVSCGSCKKTFYLDKNQTMIRCNFCGNRILYKLRTNYPIYYKTE